MRVDLGEVGLNGLRSGGWQSFQCVLQDCRDFSARDLVPRMARTDMSVPTWADAFLAEFRRPEKPSVEPA